MVEPTCEIVAEAIMNSNIKFEVDVDSIGRYIRLTTSQENIEQWGVDHLCPRRQIRRGAAPSLNSRIYMETKGLGPSDKELEKWDPPTTHPTSPTQVRKLMAVAMRIAITVFMTNYTYQFGSQTKMQEEGGSIGAGLTVQLSRVVMRKFDKEFVKKVMEEMKKLNIDTRYVDDILLAIIWDRDPSMDRFQMEKYVMEKLRGIADSVMGMLSFTSEHPEAVTTQTSRAFGQVQQRYWKG